MKVTRSSRGDTVYVDSSARGPRRYRAQDVLWAALGGVLIGSGLNRLATDSAVWASAVIITAGVASVVAALWLRPLRARQDWR